MPNAICTAGISNGIYVHLKLDYDQQIRFLLDTGASICVIKNSSVNTNIPIYKNKSTKILGISGDLQTIGTCNIQIHLENFIVPYEFHVVPDNFPIPVEGIIGANFLLEFNAILDLEKFLLTTKKGSNIIHLPIRSHEDINTISLAPRCEATYWLNTKHTEARVFYPQQLCENVFMAGSLSTAINGKIPIRILNARDTTVTLKWAEPLSSPASEHYILRYNQTDKSINARVNKIINEINFDTLNSEEKAEIEAICTKYQDIFHVDGDKLTYTHIGKADISLKKDVSPKYSKPYRLPHTQKQDIKEEIRKMLENDIIEPSVSPWNSPILIVPKKKDPVTGLQKFRMVIDYRHVNERIEDDKFPLPNITDIYDMVGGAAYFSCIDLSQGYYQMELDANSRPITAFSTEDGHYQLKRLPMGLKISPSKFSRMMSIAMSGLTYSRCFVYLDDLIVFGRSLIDHNKNLIQVFDRLREVNLKIHPGKCSFLRKEVLYLGHVISDNGILPDPTKSSAIKNYPTPTNADEVRRFVAFANYYRKFIPNFATISIPLNRLLKKDVEFNFNKDCEKSFELLKEILTSPKILQFPNFNEEFILRTDASGFALGAVLSNSDDRPIAYASKTLNKSEKNYSTIEKELLAIVWAVKHYRPYLFGRKFKILTDHRPLVYLFSLKEPSSRLTKFRLLLEEYNFYVEYSPGKDNCTADALSRIKVESEELKQLYICVVTRAQSKLDNKDENTPKDNKIQTNEQMITELLKPPESGLKVIELKIVDNFTEDLVNFKDDIIIGPNKVLAYIPKGNSLLLKKSKDSTTTQSTLFGKMLSRDVQKLCGPKSIKKIYITKNEIKKLSDGRREYKINELKNILGEIFKESNIKVYLINNVIEITDPCKKKLILNDFHILPTSGHAGINRMIQNIKKKYFWTGMQNDVTTFVKHCPVCQRNKYIQPKKQPMTITSTAESGFDKLFLDLVGPLEESEDGFKYILTIQDELTKFTEAVPISNKEASTVAKALVEGFILRYGVPHTVASDQGTEFLNQVFQKICKLLKIEQLQSTAYHHESIGALENSHKVLGAYLRSYVSEKHTDWSTWLPYYVFCYNTSVHSETGYTPFELIFGRQCDLPSNLVKQVEPVYNYDDYVIELKHKLQIAHKDARETLIGKKIARKNRFDLEERTKSSNFEIGSLVLLRNENRKKLDPIYIGPYEVLSQKGVNCDIKYENKRITVHKNRLKPFYIYLTLI